LTLDYRQEEEKYNKKKICPLKRKSGIAVSMEKDIR
jgi:hypothetical protein